MLMYIGIVLIAGAPNIILMVSITFSFFLIQYTLIVSLEEETLTSLFGEKYYTYKKHVPKILPRLTPWKKSSPSKQRPILKTLKTEKRTLQNVLLMLLLIFLRSKNLF